MARGTGASAGQSPPGGSPAPPAPRHAGTKCQRRKDRAEAHRCRGAPRAHPPPTLSSLANAQESGRPGTPRSLRLLLPGLRPPRRLQRVAGKAGRGGGRRGQRSGGCGQATQAEGLSPGAVSAGPGRSASPLRHRIFSQSGGCAGRGSWRRPCPESERHGEGASHGGQGHPERARQPPAGCRCWRSEDNAEKRRPHAGTSAARTVRAGRHRAPRPRNLLFQSAAVRTGPDPKWQPTGSWGRGGERQDTDSRPPHFRGVLGYTAWRLTAAALGGRYHSSGSPQPQPLQEASLRPPGHRHSPRIARPETPYFPRHSHSRSARDLGD